MTEAHRDERNAWPDSAEGMSLAWVAVLVLRDRRIVLAMTAFGLIVGLAVALLRPATYTSDFSFLPRSTQDASRGGLASLAGQFGISLGALGAEEPSSQLYADLLFSREVLTPIASDSFSIGPNPGERAPLSGILKVEGETPAIIVDKTLRELRSGVVAATVASKTTGMVTVRVRTRYASSSLEVAERLLQGLNHFNLVTRQSQAGQERRFTEEQLAGARAALRTAEDALQLFLQTNHSANSPQLMFERDRLQREVTLQQQLVAALAQQYEEARIREVRDTPVITVIEPPILAARADSRLRVLITAAGTCAGLFLGTLVVLFRGMKSARARQGDPALDLLAIEWKRLRGEIAPDHPVS